MTDKDELKDRDDEIAQDDAPEAADEARKSSAITDLEEDDGLHLLDLLTDEERAELEKDDDDYSDEVDEDADPESGEDAGAAEEEQPAPEPEPEAAQAPAQEQVPQLELTEDQIKEVEASMKAVRQEIRQKWSDGEMTDDEYDEAMDQWTKDRDDAFLQVYEKMQEAQEQAQLEKMKAEFQGVARAYLTEEYPDLRTDAHLARFDRHVRLVTGSQEYVGKSYREMMEAAHRLYIAEGQVLGFDVPPIKGAEPAKAESPKAAKPRRETVPTLASVPAAATNAASDGKWGSLQARFDAARTADEREAIMNSLPTEEEREAFASMVV